MCIHAEPIIYRPTYQQVPRQSLQNIQDAFQAKLDARSKLRDEKVYIPFLLLR